MTRKSYWDFMSDLVDDNCYERTYNVNGAPPMKIKIW